MILAADTADLPLLLTPTEVASLVRRRVSTVWAMIRQGRLPAFRQGQQYLIRKADALALLEPVAGRPTPTSPRGRPEVSVETARILREARIT